MSKRGVSRTAEFDRIYKLPRRNWEEQNLEQLTELLTEYVKTPTGIMKLRHIQTVALSELHDHGGLFGSIAVGYGKSLICYLAPTLLEAKRPLLLIPAKLKTKTERELKQYGEHFKFPLPIIMSYELLSRDRGQKEFLQYNPDFIIADECHRLKNERTACTKRVKRHMKDHPETAMVAVSGTITRKSIMDYHHILQWCLKDSAPLPSYWREVKDWSLALDEDLPFGNYRLGAGILLQFCEPKIILEVSKKQADELQSVRLGYKKRLIETPGIVATSDTYTGSSLLIKDHIQKQPEVIHKAFERLRTTWQTPNGEDIMDAVALWRHARELSCGFYYKWKEPAPQNWIEARKDWSKFVRDVIKSNRRGIDTQFQVAAAVARGEYRSEMYDAWNIIKANFSPETEPVWLDLKAMSYVAKWLDANAGIAWVEHVAVGQKLSEITGLPYYGQQGKDSLGRIIEDAKGPIIASIGSNSEGRNLQQWSKNMIVSCAPSAQLFEQLIGRTHRSGQPADEVSVELFMGCLESWEGFMSVIEQAKYVQNTTGQLQKILYADLDITRPDIIKGFAKAKEYAWKKS